MSIKTVNLLNDGVPYLVTAEEPQRIVEIKPKKGKYFSLEELQEYVGGYIEQIRTSASGYFMIMNEEGKLINASINQIATDMQKGIIQENDYIVGNVLIVPSKYLK